jgi:hypothetical protein
MYTTNFKIYFEDGTVEIRQGKVFPRPREEEREEKDKKEWLVLNIGLVESEEQLREELKGSSSYCKDLTFNELLDTQRQRISREQIKVLEPYLIEPTNIARMFYRVKEAVQTQYGTRYIWSVYDHNGTHLGTVGQQAKYLPLSIIKNRSSYGWKHTAESCTGRYISNGAFITACIIHGIPIDVNNCYLNPIVRFDKVVIGRIPLKAVPIG